MHPLRVQTGAQAARAALTQLWSRCLWDEQEGGPAKVALPNVVLLDEIDALVAEAERLAPRALPQGVGIYDVPEGSDLRDRASLALAVLRRHIDAHGEAGVVAAFEAAGALILVREIERFFLLELADDAPGSR